MKKNIFIILFATTSLTVFGQWSGNDSKTENGGTVQRVKTQTNSNSKTKFYYEINLTNTMAKVYGNQYEVGMKDYFNNYNAANFTNISVGEFSNFGFDQHLGWHFMSSTSRVGFQLGFGAGFGTSEGVIKSDGVDAADVELDMGYLDMEANLTYTFYEINGISAYGFGGYGLGVFHTFDETVSSKTTTNSDGWDHTENTSMSNLNFGIGADLNGLSLKGTVSIPMSSLDLKGTSDNSLCSEIFKDDLPTFFSIKIGYRI